MLEFKLLALIELEQAGVEQCHILGLKHFLLGAEQVVLFGEQFDGILHAEVELFADEVVAGLCALQLLAGGHVLLLGAVGVEPQVLDGLVERLLLVEQVQFAGLLLELGLVDGRLGLPFVVEGDAQGEAQRVVPVLLDLFGKGLPMPALRLMVGM